MLWIKSAVDRNHLEKREGRRCCEYSDQQLHADASAVHGFLWSKQDCILNNLANAETPGYKTQYVTFEESLRDAVQAAADKPQPGAAMREAIADTPVQLHEAQESVRMDDNGVDIMEQSVELARNGYQLQYVMSAISGELSLLRTAIRG